jgi:DNA-binding Xre family transcriptional regulator
LGVLADEDILFLSDKDLVFLVNNNYQKKKKISGSTFEKWKAGKFYLMKKLEKFIQCIQYALIKKQYIGDKYLMIQLVTLDKICVVLNVNFQNGILNIYQRM